jgi:hypothetical protein
MIELFEATAVRNLNPIILESFFDSGSTENIGHNRMKLEDEFAQGV